MPIDAGSQPPDKRSPPPHPIWRHDSPLQTAVHGGLTVEDVLFMHTYLLVTNQLKTADERGQLTVHDTLLRTVVNQFESLTPEVSLALIKSTFTLHPFSKLWCRSYFGVSI